MNKKLVIIVISFIVIVLGVEYVMKSMNKTSNQKYVIYTTAYAMESSLEKLLEGTNTEVISIIPKNSDIHEYTPTSEDLKNINNANMFIYIDHHYEDFASEIVNSLNKNVMVIAANELESLTSKANKNDFIDGEFVDPHTFLYPVYLSYIMDGIAEQIKLSLPDQASIIDTNLKIYEANLSKLNSMWEKMPETEIFTTHDAYYYWEEYYPVTITAVFGSDHHQEPTAQELQKIIDEMKKTNQSYFYVEPTLNPDDTSKMIMEATNTKPLPIDSIETNTSAADDFDYIDIMYRNLNYLLYGTTEGQAYITTYDLSVFNKYCFEFPEQKDVPISCTMETKEYRDQLLKIFYEELEKQQ